jgi:hypothetical protein
MTLAEDCEAKPKLPWIDPTSFKKAAREAFGIQDELDRSLKRFDFPVRHLISILQHCDRHQQFIRPAQSDVPREIFQGGTVPNRKDTDKTKWRFAQH